MMTATLDTATPHSAGSSNHRGMLDVGAVLTRGAVFALANMWYADAHGQPVVAPFLAISTIFHGTDMPVMSQPDVIAGLVTHLGLSLLFGMVFALAVVMLRLATRPLLLLGAGLVYGLALYVVNFQIIARVASPGSSTSRARTRSSNCGSTPSPTGWCWSRSSSASAPPPATDRDPPHLAGD